MGMRIIIVVHPRFLVIERTVVVVVVVVVVVTAVKDFVCGRSARNEEGRSTSNNKMTDKCEIQVRASTKSTCTHRDMQTHMHT
jgi:hypothetical protein